MEFLSDQKESSGEYTIEIVYGLEEYTEITKTTKFRL